MAEQSESRALRGGVGILERLGVSLPDAERTRLVQIWLRARIFVALGLAAVTLAVSIVWDWREGLGVTVLALVSALDSWLRVQVLPTRRPIMAVLMDVVLIHLGLALAGSPDAALGFPFSYIVISSLLLLEPRWAFAAIAVGGASITAVARDWVDLPQATHTSFQSFIIGFNGSLTFILASMGLVSVMVRLQNRSAQRQADQNRLQAALANASTILLRSSERAPLESALGELLEATDALTVFVDMNVEHPDRGLCASLLAEVYREGVSQDSQDKWALVPWDTLSGRERLEAGHSHIMRFSELEGRERTLYEDSNIRSEITFPVFVSGQWWGLLGFTDAFENRVWHEQDLTLLWAAADIVGAYIERLEARDALDDTVSNLDAQVRYHNALSACASLLQSSEDESAMELALAALLQATDADYAYIDENYLHPTAGPSSRIIHDATKPGSPSVPATGEWWDGPLSEWPTAYAGLREGRPVQIRVSELEGAEREAYLADGMKSELLIPIYVDDQWRGSVAFADYVVERRWGSHEVGALRTAARMIGAALERRETKHLMQETIDTQARKIRYQRLIADTAQALAVKRPDTALDEVLKLVLAASGADHVFIDRMAHDPNLGTTLDVTNEIIRPGHEHLARRRPADETEATVALLQRGRVATDTQTGGLLVPILDQGTWTGTLVLAMHRASRTWNTDEIAALQEIAAWIALFWTAGRKPATVSDRFAS